MHTQTPSDPLVPREGYAPVQKAQLYCREIGQGQPIIILHGGPDFDHNYLLPEMDRLSKSFRLIYYDQRGRGKSGELVQPEQVSLKSEIEDLEGLREYFDLDSVAVLGHSWGGVLAMEYAIRHPHCVSHLILMNTAPASHDDYLLLRQELPRKRAAGDAEKMKTLSSTAKYAAGDLETDAEYYRIHFRATVRQAEQLERVIKSLRLNLTPEGIVKARAIEDRLYDETWALNEYNLLPQLKRLSIPSLIIHGDYDLVPVECAAHIAQAISGARLVVLRECGHFSYLECPDEVRKEIVDFFDKHCSSTPKAAQHNVQPTIRLRQERSLLMTENILEKLFEHNNWANLRIIQACSALSDEQLDAEPPSATKGSIRRTLLHLVTSQYSYLRTLTLPLEARLDAATVAFAELQESASKSGEGLLALARGEQRPLKPQLQTRDGYLMEPWVVMVQAINHATEHREQIKSMLSALGVAPPDIDGWDYGEVTKALIPLSK